MKYQCRVYEDWEDNPDPSIIRGEITWTEIEITDEDPQWAAEKFAEQCYDDWGMPEDFPINVLVKDHGKFRVIVEYDPCFYAEEIK